VPTKSNLSSKSRSAVSTRARRTSKDRYDVIIVGAGPAGSTLAWKLASAGSKVLVLDAARFPREKVCGDYIEPRGLRILAGMGCLDELEHTSRLPIQYSSTYIDSERRYIGRIPFYGVHKHLPPHGYIIPRDVLDNVMLTTALKAGAVVRQETYVKGFIANRAGVALAATSDGQAVTYHGRLVVGADGVNSAVARSAGILANDGRHIALSQRAYADGYEGGLGEAAFFFDGDFFPGYGWMFPMSGGRVNLGVGVLKETCQRHRIAVPQLFRVFFEKLKRAHPRCRKLKLVRPPIGGIVKTYGGAGRNYFEGGLLIGDAGSFVDPMTGEGITPAMESALIAASVIRTALGAGKSAADALASYETAFRNYFDPSMLFSDLCAATLRNPHYWASWKSALESGCERAQQDTNFAATVGACFGGLELNPGAIVVALWQFGAERLLGIGLQGTASGFPGFSFWSSLLRDTAGWMRDSYVSFLEDPVWHASWTYDVQRKWINVLSMMGQGLTDPRIRGVL
jgi:geranylgeranyl reductase family protein